MYFGFKYGLCPAVAFGYVSYAILEVMDNPQRAFRLGVYLNNKNFVIFHSAFPNS